MSHRKKMIIGWTIVLGNTLKVLQKYAWLSNCVNLHLHVTLLKCYIFVGNVLLLTAVFIYLNIKSFLEMF